jgi:hypothetical protein
MDGPPRACYNPTVIYGLKILFGSALVGILGSYLILASAGVWLNVKPVIGSIILLGPPWLILSWLDRRAWRKASVAPIHKSGSPSTRS